MATNLSRNNCVAGCVAAMMNGRWSGSFTPSDYATVVNAADAVASEFITENTASGAAIADADGGGSAPQAVYAAAFATFNNVSTSDSTAADYLAQAKQIYAIAKQAISKMS